MSALPQEYADTVDFIDAIDFIDEVEPISDEELTALALADDPERPIDPDAVPVSLYPNVSPGALPLWYMPPVMAGGSVGWRRPVIIGLVLTFLLIDALGLCITYGALVAA